MSLTTRRASYSSMEASRIRTPGWTWSTVWRWYQAYTIAGKNLPRRLDWSFSSRNTMLACKTQAYPCRPKRYEISRTVSHLAKIACMKRASLFPCKTETHGGFKTMPHRHVRSLYNVLPSALPEVRWAMYWLMCLRRNACVSEVKYVWDEQKSERKCDIKRKHPLICDLYGTWKSA